MTIAEKQTYALKLLNNLLDEGCDPQTIAVAWTGGKDSTVALHLWRSVLLARMPEVAVQALTINTGYKFPEVITFRNALAKEWNIQLHEVRPTIELSDYPVASDVIRCCNELKVVPLQKAIETRKIQILITGIRRDEHPSRHTTLPVEQAKQPEHRRVHPVLEFTELDIWAYTFESQLPYCPLYDEGYRSLGCQPCTFAPDSVLNDEERAGRNAKKEENMQALRSLGYF
ncbi:phosphoadenosine phosphosulfate reductase family protein [Oleidesulfovibrio sp.]|uniref:phosphoadenosine phosphosulfate reductase family protein n=1 Tax=Oleidesulfovibrio sp. TaxID=2909707 RepID=UPI003A871A52